jgi:hypothetical protein
MEVDGCAGGTGFEHPLMALLPLLQQNPPRETGTDKAFMASFIEFGKGQDKRRHPFTLEQREQVNAGDWINGEGFLPLGVGPFPLRPFPCPFLPAFSLWLFVMKTARQGMELSGTYTNGIDSIDGHRVTIPRNEDHPGGDCPRKR